MTNIMVAFIGKWDSTTVTAPFWKYALTEHQQVLSLHSGKSKWQFVADIHKWGIGRLWSWKRSDTLLAPFWKRVSKVHQLLLFFHHGKSNLGCMAIMHAQSNCGLFRQYFQWHLNYPIMKTTVISTSTIFVLAYRVIKASHGYLSS